MKKTKVIAIAVSIIIVLGIGGFFIAVWLDDDMTPPRLPTKSVQNNLILTSNGCCFWVENIDVSLQGNNGKSVALSHNDAIYEHDIYKYAIPDFSQSPVQLIVTFRSFYGDECDFSMPVLELESVNDLKKTGVLLYFQEHDDMYLNVIAGEYRISYKMGSPESRWAVMEMPNKVYSN